MLKKFSVGILLIVLLLPCFSIIAGASVYDLSVNVVNNFLVYNDSSSVDNVFKSTENLTISGDGKYYFNEDAIDAYKNYKKYTAISLTVFDITFPTSDFLNGQSYNISFDLASGFYGNYCALAVPTFDGYTLTVLESILMRNEGIASVNSGVPSWAIVKNQFSVFADPNQRFGNYYDSGLFTSHHVSVDVDLDMSHSTNFANHLVLVFLWRSVEPQYMQLSNFKITPLGATQYLFDEAQFRDDVREGLLNIENILTEEGSTFEPAISDKSEIEEAYSYEDEYNKDFSGELESNISGSDAIFDNNGAFDFIRNTFDSLLIDDISSGIVNPFNSLIIFSLAVGLCVLILGRRLNSA